MKKLLLLLFLTGCIKYDYCYRCTVEDNRTGIRQTTIWCDVSQEQINSYVARHTTEYEKCMCIKQ